MPDLGSTDFLGISNESGPNKNKVTLFMRPYKLARISLAANIAVIFDASLSTQTGVWNASADAYNLDNNGKGFGYYTQTYMTNLYGLPSNANPAWNQGQSINLVPLPPGTAADINLDDINNWGNIRFRHNGNTQANALMLDGHVQAFTYNKTTQTTDLLRGNINVNP